MRLKPLGANRTEIHFADGTLVLFSYQTPVAAFVPGIGWIRTEKNWSRTTTKHITQWLPNKMREGLDASWVQPRPQEFFDALVAQPC